MWCLSHFVLLTSMSPSALRRAPRSKEPQRAMTIHTLNRMSRRESQTCRTRSSRNVRHIREGLARTRWWRCSCSTALSLHRSALSRRRSSTSGPSGNSRTPCSINLYFCPHVFGARGGTFTPTCRSPLGADYVLETWTQKLGHSIHSIQLRRTQKWPESLMAAAGLKPLRLPRALFWHRKIQKMQHPFPSYLRLMFCVWCFAYGVVSGEERWIGLPKDVSKKSRCVGSSLNCASFDCYPTSSHVWRLLEWRCSNDVALMTCSNDVALMTLLSWRCSHDVALMTLLEWRCSNDWPYSCSRQYWQRTALVYVFQRAHPQAAPGAGFWAESLPIIICLALAVQIPLVLFCSRAVTFWAPQVSLSGSMHTMSMHAV